MSLKPGLGVILLCTVDQVTPLESSDDAAVLHSNVGKKDAASSVPVHVETLTSLTPDPGEQGASGDSSASQTFIEPESFSDSYTHISPSLVSTSLLEASEEEAEEEGVSQEEDKGELRKTLREGEKLVTLQNMSLFYRCTKPNQKECNIFITFSSSSFVGWTYWRVTDIDRFGMKCSGDA